MTALKRWRGLAALAVDALDHGSCAVEKVQLETAGYTFRILEAIPPLAVPARAVHVFHDAGVAGVYRTIRLFALLAGSVVGAALDSAEAAREEAESKGAAGGVEAHRP